ncbi:hypothetical protein NQ315_005657 [Exocentrus adspersus]|uniref:Uncharacterized protein n=1 Tax=Exocentrus adspersus TaxID=1586481 RepID=A0AAV8V783_9CUCU|nr:hypothetical protein NQ315_005657 [Exocentrus adspersus]
MYVNKKELKKVEKYKRSDASQEDIYTPSLWYFELLIFTKNSESTSSSISNMSDDDEESNVSEQIIEENDNCT